MTTEPRSKFLGFVDAQADAVNKRPSVKGELARADGTMHSFAVWGGATKDGQGIYLRGTVTPKDAAAAIAAKVGDVADVEQPAGLDLKVGEIVLFENDKGDNDKRPDFYGYSRTAEGINRHSVWSAVAANGSLMLRGTTELFVPKAAANDAVAAADSAPTAPAAEAKTKVHQALRQAR